MEVNNENIEQFNTKLKQLNTEKTRLEIEYSANKKMLESKIQEYESKCGVKLDLNNLDNIISEVYKRIEVDYTNGMQLMENLEKELGLGGVVND